MYTKEEVNDINVISMFKMATQTCMVVAADSQTLDFFSNSLEGQINQISNW